MTSFTGCTHQIGGAGERSIDDSRAGAAVNEVES
jgi:hypothetical protein